MKKATFIFLLFVQQYAHSQGLGIGTNPPHVSAELDVNSTTRGMLIPRMTATQRAAIANPAAGLLVFQTDNFIGSPSSISGLYIYETNNAIVGWKRIAKAEDIAGGGSNSWVVSGTNQSSGVTGNVGIGTNTPSSKLHIFGNTLVEGSSLTIDNDFASLYLKSGNSNKAYLQLRDPNFDMRLGTVGFNTTGKVFIQTNGTDRLTVAPDGLVGVGTVNPTERLHVNGNILSSGRVDANGVIEGAGLSSSGSLYVNGTSLLQGAVTGNVTASFTGNINSNASISINDPAAILQLKSSNVDKGFVQLSGENLRIGTNSGNTTGNIVFRNDGTDIMEMRKNGTGSWLQLNANGVSNGVLQATSSGTLSLSNPIANEQLQLGGEIFIDGTANHVGVGTSNPTERLHVNGNQLVSGNSTVGGNGSVGGDMVVGNGKLTSNVTTSSYNLLPVCYGRVSENGTKQGGTPNFTVSRQSLGLYYIYCAQASASSVIMVNTEGTYVTHHAYYDTDHIVVYSYADDRDDIDARFHFVVFDP